MLTIRNNERHALWGRSFPGYFKSYTNQALAVPLSPLEEPHVRIKAAKTLEWIIALGRAPKGDRHGAARYITLSMLKSILDTTKIPEDITRLADPRLIAGCVELMASVEPVFGYEYGYVCFRILNFAIGACLLKQFGRLDVTIERMRSASDGQLVFWSDAAAVVYWDIRHAGRIILGLCLIFTEDALDRLMNLLHDNQKQYFIVLKVLESMGLSGLMLTLRAHIQVRGVVISNNTKCGDLVESRIQPYSRLLWRYLLPVPTFIEHEARAVYEIHIDVTYWARFREPYFIDVEDSRNLLQALNERLVLSSMPQLTPAMILLRFVEPLVVPGCEDLVPTLVERSLRLMWNAIENNDTCSSTARVVITSVLMSIRYIFQEIKPKSFDHQQWIVQLVDIIINESPTDLILRVLITAPDFVPGQQDVTERLYNIASEFYEDLVNLAPRSYFVSRLHDSGVLADWHKYVSHFLGADTLEAPTGSSLRSSRKACGEATIHTLVVVLDKKCMNELYSGARSCDYPRCPVPCDAAYICAECVDLVYCSTRCLTADWLAPWRGLHKRVCQQQPMANPKSRTSYHRNIMDMGRRGIHIAERNDMDVQGMILGYYCNESEWKLY